MKKKRMKIMVIGLIAGFIGGAFLLPQLIGAGSLEPLAPPGPTMKTLNEIPPTWSQKLNSTNGSTADLILGCNSDRFHCIFYESGPGQVPLPQAVLDKETGLVWERSPDSNQNTWSEAFYSCLFREISEREGWRLPTFEEISTLVSSGSTDRLPDGHPFRNIQVGNYWSSTTVPGSSNEALVQLFGTQAGDIGRFEKPTRAPRAWCVRGGKGYDGY